MDARFRALLQDQLGCEPEEITLEANIRHDLGADSLDRIELFMRCESAFGIDISDEDAEDLFTVGAAIAYLERRTAQTKTS